MPGGSGGVASVAVPGGSGRVASVAVPGGSVEWLLWRCVGGVG